MSTIARGVRSSSRTDDAQKTPQRYGRFGALLLLSVDSAIFAISANLACRWHLGFGLSGQKPTLLAALAIAALVWLFVFRAVGLYRGSFAGTAKDEIYTVIVALAIGLVPELLIFTIISEVSPSRLTLLAFAGIALIGDGTARAVLRLAGDSIRSNAERRIAIVGTKERIAAVVAALHPRRRDAVLRIVVKDFDATMRAAERPAFVPWMRGALEWGASQIIVTEMVEPEYMSALIAETESRRIMLAFAPPRIRTHAYELTIERTGTLSLIRPRSLPICTPEGMLFRRALDLLIAIPTLVALAPLFILVAVAIRCDSPGPIIFRQIRIGRGGRPFEMLKFRSMPLDAEARTGPVWANLAQPRATRVGKFLRRLSIDELPQLLNVARGDMSLIGPRPERPHFVEEFQKTLPRYDDRHLISPGITGWAQLTLARILTPADAGDKLACDIYYIENWSPLMDLSILVKTFVEVLFHRVA